MAARSTSRRFRAANPAADFALLKYADVHSGQKLGIKKGCKGHKKVENFIKAN